MFSKKHSLFAVAFSVAALFVIAPATVSAANIILDGGFESMSAGDYNAYGFKDLSLGSPSADLPNWNLSSSLDNFESGINTAEDTHSYVPAAQEGTHYLNIVKSNKNGQVSQTFSVTGGNQYAVSYYWMPRPAEEITGAQTQASITLDGATGGVVDTTTGGTPGTWSLQTFTFTPSASVNATLTFQAANDIGNGVYIDNVSVANVPEPSVLLLLGVGLAGLLAYAWRRRQ